MKNILRNFTNIIVILLTYGCNSNSSDSSIESKWVQNGCNSIEGLNLWVQATYEFTHDGELQYDVDGYIDSNCVQKPTAFISGSPVLVVTLDSTTVIEEYMQFIHYTDNGKQVLQEGVLGGSMVISLDLYPETIDVDVNYYMNNNMICFSRAFIVNEKNMHFSKVDNGAIDFNNCLGKSSP
jgi:hypothetical protein